MCVFYSFGTKNFQTYRKTDKMERNIPKPNSTLANIVFLHYRYYTRSNKPHTHCITKPFNASQTRSLNKPKFPWIGPAECAELLHRVWIITPPEVGGGYPPTFLTHRPRAKNKKIANPWKLWDMALSRRQKILQAGPKPAAASKIGRSHQKTRVFEEIHFRKITQQSGKSGNIGGYPPPYISL